MIPVSGSIERSITSTLTTWVHLGLGYFLHIPMTTWDQGCLLPILVRCIEIESHDDSLVLEELRENVHFVLRAV